MGLKELINLLRNIYKRNLIIKHLIGDSFTIIFLIYPLWFLYDFFQEVVKNIDLFFNYFIVFLYSLTLSFSITYRQDEKALKMISILTLLLLTKTLFPIIKNFYIITLFIISSYYTTKQLEKRHFSFTLIEYTAISTITTIIATINTQTHPKNLFGIFAIFFLMFVAIGYLIHIFQLARLPSDILGYDLVIAKVPQNIELSLLHEILQNPLIVSNNNLIYKLYYESRHPLNVIISSSSMVGGTIIHHFSYERMRLLRNSKRIKIPTTGHFEEIIIYKNAMPPLKENDIILLNNSLYLVKNSEIINVTNINCEDKQKMDEFMEKIAQEKQKLLVLRQSKVEKFIEFLSPEDIIITLIIKKDSHKNHFKSYFVITMEKFGKTLSSPITQIIAKNITNYLKNKLNITSKTIQIQITSDDDNIFSYHNNLIQYITYTQTLKDITQEEIEYVNEILISRNEQIENMYKNTLGNINTIISATLALLSPIVLSLLGLSIFKII